MNRQTDTGTQEAGRIRRSLKERGDLRERTAAALAGTRFFTQVSAEILSGVLAESSLLSMKQGELLIRQGSEDIDSMYILLKGVLDVSIDNKQIFSLTETGESFGEIAPIVRQPRIADIRCRTDALVIEIPAAALAAKRSVDPTRYAQFLEMVAVYLAGKLRQATSRVDAYDNQLLEQTQLRSRSAELQHLVQEKLREVVLYSHAFQNSQDGIILADAMWDIISANPTACKWFGWPESQKPQRYSLLDVFPRLKEKKADLANAQGAGFKEEWVLSGTTLGFLPVEAALTPVVQEGIVVARALFLRDIRGHKMLLESLELSQAALSRYSKELEEKVEARTSELRRSNQDLMSSNARLLRETERKEDALQKLKETQSHLLQSEKMIGLGRLAAGVAHEINNPIGFVRSNLGTLKEYVAGLVSLLKVYEEADRALDGNAQAQALRERIRAQKKDIGYEYLLGDLRPLIDDAQEGVSRVAGIVSNLKEFTHLDEAQWQFSDVNAGLESTIKLLRNELKHKAEMKREYGTLPEIECQPQQLNQVFLNVLLNAVQSIEKSGTITVRTGLDPHTQSIVVTIQDTGCGISEANLPHIYEPFFTTKPVGKGMGLGLTSAYNIVRNHQGSIHTESAVNVGTTVTIKLPARQARSQHVESGHE